MIRMRLVMALAGIAAASTAAMAQDTTRASVPRAPRTDIIYRDQFEHGNHSNAYEIVRSLKRSWLTARPESRDFGAGSVSGMSRDTTERRGGLARSGTTGSPVEADGIQVYVDGSRVGGIAVLRNIPAQTVFWIRRYSAADAQVRFGFGHSAGVIFVSTRDEPPGN